MDGDVVTHRPGESWRVVVRNGCLGRRTPLAGNNLGNHLYPCNRIDAALGRIVIDYCLVAGNSYSQY